MKHCITAMMIVLAASAAQAGDCYSNGIRVGDLQKFSQKGINTKSWEGELVLEGTKLKGGYKTGTSGGNVWRFSVTDPAVAKAIDDAMMAGAPVALRYCQALIRNPLSTDTGYVVTQAVQRKAQ